MSTMSDRLITSWIVPLKGATPDLEDLPIGLAGSSVTVVKREDKYFLQLPTSVAGTTYERVGEHAVDLVAIINGVASVCIQGYRPIEIEGGALYGLDQHGDVMHTVMQVNPAELRLKGNLTTVLINGGAQPDSRSGSLSSFLTQALHNRAKANALTLVGRLSPTWSELYVAYELVQSHAGSRMITDRWISESDATLFKRTACNYNVLGVMARHGDPRFDPPDEPMQHQTAVALMRSLVKAWLQDSSATSSP
jgi:hypothetical protein